MFEVLPFGAGEEPKSEVSSVRIDSVSKTFGKFAAVKAVTLDVKAGEFLSLLGPSGCGKTTLLRICAGLERPSSGRIFVEGRDVTDWPAHIRPVNMVFQQWALFPHMTVAENIAFGLEVRNIDKARIANRVRLMLDMVKMVSFADRYPKQLSGGQAQRIALARALALEPKVLLLDEPLGSLDFMLRKEMQMELVNIHQQLGTSFIYVTHDQEEALTMSNRVAIMNDGSIEQEGSPLQIYQQPKSVFAAQFIGESVLLAGRIQKIGRVSCAVNADGSILHGPFRPDLKIGQSIVICVRPERIRITARANPALENHLKGTVINAIFKGAAVHYRVRIDGGGGSLLTVHQKLEQDQPSYSLGAVVHLGWSVASAVLLNP
jgi:spermidine/putrescine ABC transporter ATP-binding subunit